MVESSLAEGISADRIAFFAFTKKAANEAIVRAQNRFGYSSDDLPWFRTLHSAAFRLLGLKREEVMSTEHYKELGKALGSFTFSEHYNETTERPPFGGGLGDRALAIHALARAKGISLEEEWHRSFDPRISLLDAQRFEMALNRYKQERGMVDFADFMEPQHHAPLDVDIIIIDEAQDLTHQQWAFARTIGAEAKRVIIAGDDDQCIFQWSGADLKSFLSFRGNLRTLPLSHRLPRKIWSFANQIVSRIGIRKSKIWSPRDEEGEIHHLDHPDQALLSEGKNWLLLARHQYQLATLRKICRDQGVVYQEGGVWSNQASTVRGVVAYESVRTGGRISPAQALNIARYIPGMSPPEPTEHDMAWNDIAWPFQGQPDWMAAMTGIGTDEMEYIRRLRREGESLSKPGRIIISTIHGVKGGEAENVLLVPDVSKRALEGFEHFPDQELRVWYVAASRASQRLFLTRPQTKLFFKP